MLAEKQIRMKQAREEAEAEITAFRAQKESSFQKQQAAVHISCIVSHF